MKANLNLNPLSSAKLLGYFFINYSQGTEGHLKNMEEISKYSIWCAQQSLPVVIVIREKTGIIVSIILGKSTDKEHEAMSATLRKIFDCDNNSKVGFETFFRRSNTFKISGLRELDAVQALKKILRDMINDVPDGNCFEEFAQYN